MERSWAGVIVIALLALGIAISGTLAVSQVLAIGAQMAPIPQVSLPPLGDDSAVDRRPAGAVQELTVTEDLQTWLRNAEGVTTAASAAVTGTIHYGMVFGREYTEDGYYAVAGQFAWTRQGGGRWRHVEVSDRCQHPAPQQLLALWEPLRFCG